MILFLIFFTFINLIIFFKIDYFIKLYNIYDNPIGDRKIHKIKISVFGGGIVLINLIFILLFIVFFDLKITEFINNNRNLFLFFIIPIFIFFIGLFDDSYLIKNNIKFFLLIIFVSLGVFIDSSIIIDSIKFSWISREIMLLNFSSIFTILCILTLMNSLNFIDGIDLLLGIYSILIFSIFFYLSKSIIFIPLIITLINFCILNYKGKLFLGDAGSLLIAYLISIFLIKLNQINIINVEQIVMLTIIPIVDCLRVFASRFLNRVSILKPDKNHIHHLLLNNYGTYKVNIILQSLIFIPYFMSTFLNFYYVIILLQISIYLICVINFKNKKKEI